VEYQTFRGTDVHEALFAVRQALGADALIESTREINNGRTGGLGYSFVEVVAKSNRNAKSSAASVDGSELDNRSRIPRTRGKLDVGALEKEVIALRGMVQELSAARPPKERAAAMLCAAGFEGELVRKLSTGAAKHTRSSREVLRGWLRERVSEHLSYSSNLIERPFRQLIACVGPTGVGKTTTLAKLAARARLDLHRSVTVITTDTFRVGAVEQWKRYAELIGVSFFVAEDAITFQRVAQSQSSDLVLVDTAGRSSGTDAAAIRLAQAFDSVQGLRTEVLLTLPAWIRANDAERITASYNAPTLTGVVVTKMDEAEQFAGALHAAMVGELPLAYLCDGARVPEDIQEATSGAILNALFPEAA
jgi:flagellar biosynthesis protein FlhF